MPPFYHSSPSSSSCLIGTDASMAVVFFASATAFGASDFVAVTDMLTVLKHSARSDAFAA